MIIIITINNDDNLNYNIVSNLMSWKGSRVWFSACTPG